jgi:hypothetical protein
MAIQNSAVTNVASNIFVCPGTLVTDVQEHAVTCMIFCNYSGSAVDLDVWAVPQGTPLATSSNQIIKSLNIPAGETFTFDTEKLVLSTGDRITVAVGSGQDNRLTATVSSMRVS